MDYADIDNVKLGFANQSLSAGQQARLQTNLTEASRAIDRELAQTSDPSSDNYLMLETVVNEELRAIVDRQGRITCYPHKPTISQVTSLSYRQVPGDDWHPGVLPLRSVIRRDRVMVWSYLNFRSDEFFVQVSYVGGYAEDGHPEQLPGEIHRVAKVLAIRYYHEEEGGLNDAMGVTDFGTPIITKAMPIESKIALSRYKRAQAW